MTLRFSHSFPRRTLRVFEATLAGEVLTKFVYPEASNIVVFVIMAVVLMWRPSGLFGKE